jgi:hypothetical protein
MPESDAADSLRVNGNPQAEQKAMPSACGLLHCGQFMGIRE